MSFCSASAMLLNRWTTSMPRWRNNSSGKRVAERSQLVHWTGHTPIEDASSEAHCTNLRDKSRNQGIKGNVRGVEEGMQKAFRKRFKEAQPSHPKQMTQLGQTKQLGKLAYNQGNIIGVVSHHGHQVWSDPKTAQERKLCV